MEQQFKNGQRVVVRALPHIGKKWHNKLGIVLRASGTPDFYDVAIDRVELMFSVDEIELSHASSAEQFKQIAQIDSVDC